MAMVVTEGLADMAMGPTLDIMAIPLTGEDTIGHIGNSKNCCRQIRTLP